MQTPRLIHGCRGWCATQVALINNGFIVIYPDLHGYHFMGLPLVPDSLVASITSGLRTLICEVCMVCMIRNTGKCAVRSSQLNRKHEELSTCGYITQSCSSLSSCAFRLASRFHKQLRLGSCLPSGRTCTPDRSDADTHRTSQPRQSLCVLSLQSLPLKR